MNKLTIENYKNNIIQSSVSPFYIQNERVYAVGTQNDINDIRSIQWLTLQLLKKKK